MTIRTTIACQKSGWTKCYEADEQYVNFISLFNDSAANAAPSASGGRYAPLMEQSLYQIEFKELRNAYREVKTFLELETAGEIISVKMDIEEDLQIAGDDTYELMDKFLTVYRLEANGFDVTKHFLSEGEQFNSGIAILQLLSLPFLLGTWLLRLLTFGKIDYTKKVVLPEFGRQTTGLTFGDLVTWYIVGKFSLRKDVRFVLKQGA